MKLILSREEVSIIIEALEERLPWSESSELSEKLSKLLAKEKK